MAYSRILSAFFVLGLATPAIAAIDLETVDGRTWHDFNLDGSFSDGVSSPTASSLIAFKNTTNAARAAIEFDLSAIPTDEELVSATLRLYFPIARDLNDLSEAGFGPPDVELLGFVGNAQSFFTDVLATDLLASFSPLPQSFVTIDVTGFVRSLQATSEQYAGFTVRIEHDLSPNTFAEAWFTSSFGDPNQAPLLSITTQAVPEPGSLAIWIVGAFGLAAGFRLRQGLPGLASPQAG